MNLDDNIYHSDPWPFWEIHDVFDTNTLEFLHNVELTEFNSRLVTDSNRDVFRFTKKNAKKYSYVAKIVNKLLDSQTIQLLEKIGERVGAEKFKHSYVRVDLTIDKAGFNLKPHLDRKSKLFTMQVFLPDRTCQQNVGTEIYNEQLQIVHKLPFTDNCGYFFYPRSKHDKKQWHGMMHPCTGDRRTLLVNYICKQDEDTRGEELVGYKKLLSNKMNTLEDWWNVR